MKMEQKCSLCTKTLSLQGLHWTNAFTTAAVWVHHAPRKAYFAHSECHDSILPADTEQNNISTVSPLQDHMMKFPNGQSKEDHHFAHPSGHASTLPADTEQNSISTVSPSQDHMVKLPNGQSIADYNTKLYDAAQCMIPATGCAYRYCIYGGDSYVDQTGRVLVYQPGPIPTEKDDLLTQLDKACFEVMLETQALELDDDGYI